MNLTPQFSAVLVELIARRNLTQVAAAEITGISRNVLVRLARGEQWPNHEHISAVARLAAQDSDRTDLVSALQGDVAAAAGLDRFKVAEDGKTALVEVPSSMVDMVEGVVLLGKTSPTGRIAIESVVESLTPAILRKEALDFDTKRLIAKPRKNGSAPSYRTSLPPRSKAS